MEEIVVASTARTPFGKFGGSLINMKAPELGGLAIKEALRRAGITGEAVDEVIMGDVITAGQGQVPARQAEILGGIPHHVPSFTINKVCGSALKAVTLATQIMKAGDADVIVAGGMESMSNAPFSVPGARWGHRMNNGTLVDNMVHDGLWCPENDVHMAVIGGQVAKEYGVTREEQDHWSYRSQMRWKKAEEEGFFNEERFPIEIKEKKSTWIFDKDESPRPDTTLDGLAALKPVFDPDGSVTAGNAPGVNDGASAVVLMTRKKAKELGAPILATINGYAQASRESRYISTVPGLSIQALMKQHGLTLADIDRIEINEAFAAVPLVSGRVLGMTYDEMDAKINVNGGAVAVGHPIGATGARILMTMINELRRSHLKNGICAICSGMGQGDAVWVSVE